MALGYMDTANHELVLLVSAYQADTAKGAWHTLFPLNQTVEISGLAGINTENPAYTPFQWSFLVGNDTCVSPTKVGSVHWFTKRFLGHCMNSEYPLPFPCSVHTSMTVQFVIW